MFLKVPMETLGTSTQALGDVGVHCASLEVFEDVG